MSIVNNKIPFAGNHCIFFTVVRGARDMYVSLTLGTVRVTPMHLCVCYVAPTVLGSGVTKVPLDNFPAVKTFDFTKIPSRFFESL